MNFIEASDFDVFKSWFPVVSLSIGPPQLQAPSPWSCRSCIPQYGSRWKPEEHVSACQIASPHITMYFCTWWHGAWFYDNKEARFLYTIKLHPWTQSCCCLYCPVPEIPQTTPSSCGHKKPRDCRAAPLKPAVLRRDATWLEKCRDSRGDMQWNGNQKRINELHNEDSSCMRLSILPSYILNGQFRWDSQAWDFFVIYFHLLAGFILDFQLSPKATRFNCDMARTLLHLEHLGLVRPSRQKANRITQSLP